MVTVIWNDEWNNILNQTSLIHHFTSFEGYLWATNEWPRNHLMFDFHTDLSVSSLVAFLRISSMYFAFVLIIFRKRFIITFSEKLSSSLKSQRCLKNKRTFVFKLLWVEWYGDFLSFLFYLCMRVSVSAPLRNQTKKPKSLEYRTHTRLKHYDLKLELKRWGRNR